MTTTEVHPRQCTAHKRNGARCTRWAIAGGTTCPSHGGSAPAVKAAAQRRLLARQAEAEASAVLAHEGLARVEDPLGQLGLLASEVLAFKDALARRVNAIRGELSTINSLGTEALRVEVELYERALDRSGKFLDMLVRNGFEEKRVRLQEAQAAALFGALNRTLMAAGLNPEQLEAARAQLAQELRALDVVDGDPR